GEDESVEQGLALGGDGYVIKPFNAVALAAQITELLAPNAEGCG
nr:DNA-binding response regulator [Gemmatimonadales bacterium]